MASMRRRVHRRNLPALPPGRRPGQPRAADDPPTFQQVRRKDLWDRHVDGEGLGDIPNRWLFPSMADLPGA